MEHLRSTLATTACAVFGLVAAAHILHPGNFEHQSPPARPVVAQAAAAPVAVWTDPPPDLLRSSRMQAGEAALAPRLTLALPAGEMMAPALPVVLAMPANPPARAVAVRPHKGAQRPARQRQAVLAQVHVAPVQVAPPVPRKAASGPRADPLRGLGLDRDG